MKLSYDSSTTWTRLPGRPRGRWFEAAVVAAVVLSFYSYRLASESIRRLVMVNNLSTATTVAEWVRHDVERNGRPVESIGGLAGRAVRVLDHAGRCVALPRPGSQGTEDGNYARLGPVAEALQGRSNTGEYADPVTGQVMIAACVPVEVAGQRWVVLAQQSREEAYAPIRIMGWQIGGGVGVLVLAGAVIMARSRSRIRRLNRKLADRSLRMHEMATIVESSDDAIMGHTLDGHIMTWNAGAEKLFGYSALEMKGRALAALAAPERAGEMHGALERIRAGAEVARLETVWLRRDGGPVDVWLTVSPTRNPAGAVTGAATIARDVSGRKRTEESLARQARELAGYSTEMEQVAYATAHDLQEPLRMVGSYTQLLAERYRGRLDKEADEFIAYAVEGAKRMQEQLNDMLVFSRIGRSQKPFELVDCEAVVRAAVSGLKAVIQESGAEIARGPLPVVMGDVKQLAQVFEQLLGNALKFRRAEEPPRISIQAGLNGKEWLFAVRDNGIGIEPQYLERMFTLFCRLHPRGKYPGTGMGLAICKKIVERHGGRICAESEPGKGSTFCFTLPAKKDAGT
ncbi:MAG: PAS domain S-box protein [Verrucomicrobia bacterium]|nr:PAS domain S-box protein [Verrucomicrobiota bacterium]